MPTEKTLYIRIALEEMQDLYKLQLASFDAIKNTVRAVLSAASLIVSLVGALQLLSIGIRPDWIWLYQAGIGAVVVLYVALIAMCIAGLWPVKPFSPLASEWNELTTAYQGLSEEDALLKRLSSQLSAINLNKPLVKRLAWKQIAVLILLPILVVVILSLALIPRG